MWPIRTAYPVLWAGQGRLFKPITSWHSSRSFDYPLFGLLVFRFYARPDTTVRKERSKQDPTTEGAYMQQFGIRSSARTSTISQTSILPSSRPSPLPPAKRTPWTPRSGGRSPTETWPAAMRGRTTKTQQHQHSTQLLTPRSNSLGP